MSEVMVKGSVVNAFARFIKRKWGVYGYDEAMKFAGMKELPKDGDWVPIAQAYRFVEWVRDNHGERYIVEMGRTMPSVMGGELKFVFASILRFEKLLKKVQKDIPAMMFKGAVVTVDVHEGKEATVSLKGVRAIPEACLLWKGALEGLMHRTHKRGDVREVEAPEDTCSYRLSW